MRLFIAFAALCITCHATSAQGPIKTIEDGALDRIELFINSLEGATRREVVIRPFDASAADLGTGGKEGKDTRQQEAQTMQNEGPRVLAERFVASLKSSGPFKIRYSRATSPHRRVPWLLKASSSNSTRGVGRNDISPASARGSRRSRSVER